MFLIKTTSNLSTLNIIMECLYTLTILLTKVTTVDLR